MADADGVISLRDLAGRLHLIAEDDGDRRLSVADFKALCDGKALRAAAVREADAIRERAYRHGYAAGLQRANAEEVARCRPAA